MIRTADQKADPPIRYYVVTKTEKMIYKVEDFIKNKMMAEFDKNGNIIKDGVINWTSFIGSGPPRFYLSLNSEQQSPEYAFVKLNVTDRWKMETEIFPKIENFCLENFPDLSPSWINIIWRAGGPFGIFPG